MGRWRSSWRRREKFRLSRVAEQGGRGFGDLVRFRWDADADALIFARTGSFKTAEIKMFCPLEMMKLLELGPRRFADTSVADVPNPGLMDYINAI